MILLIAFRGIAGDAMAYDMRSGLLQKPSPVESSGDPYAMKSIANHADSMLATPQFGLKNFAAMPCHESPLDASSQATPDDAAHACTACMVCHSSVLESPPFIITLPKLAAAYALVQDMTWLSADLPHVQKPPVF